MRYYTNGTDLEVFVATIGGNGNAMRHWVACGCVAELMAWLSVRVFYTDEDGNCVERFNPTIKRVESRKAYTYDFDWVLEATDENEGKIILEIERRYDEWKMSRI